MATEPKDAGAENKPEFEPIYARLSNGWILGHDRGMSVLSDDDGEDVWNFGQIVTVDMAETWIKGYGQGFRRGRTAGLDEKARAIRRELGI